MTYVQKLTKDEIPRGVGTPDLTGKKLVKFLKSAPIMTGRGRYDPRYAPGDEVWIDEHIADRLIESGRAELLRSSPDAE